ncbi:RecQ family ATP-dependent DNA helicase [Bacillus sp. FJAT-45037]|uniref:RecQ family ATP-dependent DNA helicase n=1 Tax=Bacillus sp. FJAT-45037 TaxID=2011007 RepID=UPI000C23EAED|nr:ATP-dependent DNA helicase RecQ [Bacillus sp. FJAT-45037]
MQLLDELKKWFGYSSFRPGQKEIVEAVVKGEDVLAVLPTGTGKSICYQLPGLILPGVTIIVSPLLSLMEDQVQQLRSEGIKSVVAVNSFMSYQERQSVVNHLHEYKLIYTSPEMLQSEFFRSKLKTLQVSLFVVDEAHCISQWGHEFRSDYLRLASVRKQLGHPPCLAITATATTTVQKDICHYLNMVDVKRYIHSVNRPNIALQVETYVTTDEKLERLLELIESLEGPGMVYFSSRMWSESVARKLMQKGISDVNFYHGGMTTEDRLLIQQQFMQGELNIICCTSAFGMGINKNNIRYVIHFHYPTQMESYVQEIGRAGRDGEDSLAIVLFSEEDRGLAKLLSVREQLTPDQVRTILERLQRESELSEKMVSEICAQAGCSEVVWRNMLFALEELDVIESGRIKRFSVDAITERLAHGFTQYKISKQKQLTAFEHWLQLRTCRRSGMLQYFNESPQKNDHKCCDRCRFELDDYRKTNTQSAKQELVLHWEQELKKRFLIPFEASK